MNAISKELEQGFFTQSVIGDQPYPSYELRNILACLGEWGDVEFVESVLKRVGLDWERLWEEPSMPTHRLLQTLDLVRERYATPGLGCAIGQSYTLASLGEIGVQVATCRTLGEALVLVERNYDQLGVVMDKSLTLQGDQVVVRHYNVSGLDHETLDFLMEICIAAFFTVAREVAGFDFPLRYVSFTREPPTDQKIYRLVFGDQLRFSQPFIEWAFDVRLLEEPVRVHLADATPMREQPTYLQFTAWDETSLVQRISDMLYASRGFPELPEIAKRLNMSPRTLRRRLATAGINYQRLLNRIRCQQAIALLQEEALAVDDIADRLGFTEVANFRHAFKKWLGLPPGAVRSV
ncbi:AraC family transcriptional regulator [Hahella sp. HN01]|uniref:AraC family transcriptional regulator n=1 Tax=Hahella sp. HN01 TaxID=2847262 RepID=UPI001C1EC19B|nr:AraC family transcriptional regulator [Hahella sp. HN01]